MQERSGRRLPREHDNDELDDPLEVRRRKKIEHDIARTLAEVTTGVDDLERGRRPLDKRYQAPPGGAANQRHSRPRPHEATARKIVYGLLVLALAAIALVALASIKGFVP